MAKKRIDDRSHTATFLNNMKNEYGSGQKAFDRIFELALGHYLELQHKGEVALLFPHKVVTPRTKSIHAFDSFSC